MLLKISKKERDTEYSTEKLIISLSLLKKNIKKYSLYLEEVCGSLFRSDVEEAGGGVDTVQVRHHTVSFLHCHFWVYGFSNNVQFLQVFHLILEMWIWTIISIQYSVLNSEGTETNTNISAYINFLCKIKLFKHQLYLYVTANSKTYR